jgi:hypothetical protein
MSALILLQIKFWSKRGEEFMAQDDMNKDDQTEQTGNPSYSPDSEEDF